MKKSQLAIVAASLFNRKDEDGQIKLDSNNLQGVYLTPIAGVIPNRNILSGTVAENSGFVPGNSYLVRYQRTEDRLNEEDGEMYPNVTFTNLGKPTMRDMIEMEESHGVGELADVYKYPIVSTIKTTPQQEEESEATPQTKGKVSARDTAKSDVQAG